MTKITTDTGEILGAFRKPVSFEKIGKRWYAVFTNKAKTEIKIPVKHIRSIK